MEVTMRKKRSLSSLIAAGTIALGAIGLYSPQGMASPILAAPIDNAETDLVGTYGVKTAEEGYFGVKNNLRPGENPDPGMSERSEDLLQFTGTNFNIGRDGELTTFAWKTNFGERGKVDNITINIVGGTNVFDNQGIYMGSRNEDGGVGGQTYLNISGGTNLFTQRVIVGGEGDTAGKSTINISGGTNIFTYNKAFNGSEITTLGRKSGSVADWTGYAQNKYLGDNKFASAMDPEDKNWDTTMRAYGSLNMYNYYNNYYGVYLSAMASGNKTEGVELTISGGKNMFNVATYIGGGYDLTSYCSVNTSADDDDVVKGGVTTVNITGGFTNFASRTYFGAEQSQTTVNFSGRSTTYFGGTAISEDMDLALANSNLEVPGSYAAYTNEYKGGDLPYVFLGGKNGISTEVNVNGFNENMTTLDIQTSTFVGGAHETWLAGDQYLQETLDDQLIYTFRDATSSVSGNFQNGIRHDDGAATFNLNSGKVRLGYVNTTPIVKTRNNDNWNYKDTDPYGTVYNVTDYQDRYEQIRLIGAATGSQFNATGGRIQFDVAVHAEQAGIIAAASANGYSGYFADEFSDTDAATGVLNLEAAMIAFDQIHIGKDVDITVGGIGKIMARGEKESGSIVFGQREFYTNAVFVDTTVASYRTTDVLFKDNQIIHGAEKKDNNVVVDLSTSPIASADQVSPSTYENLVYDKWLYRITLEDVQQQEGTTGIQTTQVRLRIETKGLEENYIGNIENNGDTFTEVLLTGDERCPAVYDVVEQIADSSKTAEEAARNFDQLVGTGYANYASAQIRRITNFNSMLEDQILASDICIKNLRTNGNGQKDCNGNCMNWTAWGHFYGDTGKVGMHDYISGYNTDTWGGMFAIDWTNCESCHIGGFFDYAKLSTDSSAPMGYTSIKSDTYTVGVYAKWLGLCCTGGYGSIIASVGFSSIDATRELYLDDSFNADTNAVLPSVFYERGWVFYPCEKFSINPFFNLQYAYYGSNAFTEYGVDEVGDPSSLALAVGRVDHHSLRTQVGVRLNNDWMIGADRDRRITTRFKGSWIHDLLGQVDPIMEVYHTGYSDFPIWQVTGNNAGRDWALLGAGIDFNASARLSFLVDYNCYVNEFTTIHAGMGTLRFSF